MKCPNCKQDAIGLFDYFKGKNSLSYTCPHCLAKLGPSTGKAVLVGVLCFLTMGLSFYFSDRATVLRYGKPAIVLIVWFHATLFYFLGPYKIRKADRQDRIPEPPIEIESPDQRLNWAIIALAVVPFAFIAGLLPAGFLGTSVSGRPLLWMALAAGAVVGLMVNFARPAYESASGKWRSFYDFILRYKRS